jgi:hypothetical protein
MQKLIKEKMKLIKKKNWVMNNEKINKKKFMINNKK